MKNIFYVFSEKGEIEKKGTASELADYLKVPTNNIYRMVGEKSNRVSLKGKLILKAPDNYVYGDSNIKHLAKTYSLARNNSFQNFFNENN